MCYETTSLGCKTTNRSLATTDRGLAGEVVLDREDSLSGPDATGIKDARQGLLAGGSESDSLELDNKLADSLESNNNKHSSSNSRLRKQKCSSLA